MESREIKGALSVTLSQHSVNHRKKCHSTPVTDAFTPSLPAQSMKNLSAVSGAILRDNTSKPQVLWKVQVKNHQGILQDTSLPPVVDSSGTAYVTGTDAVYAVNISSGMVTWKLPGEISIIDPATLVQGEKEIIIGDSRGNIHCFEKDSGKERWVSNIAKSTCTAYASVSSDGTIYAGTVEGKVIALRGKDGGKLWETHCGASCAMAPAVGSDNTLYTVSFDKKVHAIDGATGKEKWSTPVEGTTHCPPVLGNDGSLIVTLSEGRILSLDRADGKEHWSFDARNTLYDSMPAVCPDNTVVFNTRYDFIALDGDNGREKWRIPLDDVFGTRPVTEGNDAIALALSNGKVMSVESSTGKQKWEIKMRNQSRLSPPALDSEGNLVFGCDFSLYCLKPPLSPDDGMLEKVNERDRPEIESMDDFVIVDGVRVPIQQ